MPPDSDSADDSARPAVGYPAGLWRRLGALLYDSLLVLAVWMTTLLVWVVVSGGEAVSGWPVQAVLLMEWAGLYVYSLTRDGQTLGMRAWRLKALQSDGQSPTAWQAIVRWLGAGLSLVCLGLGYVWLLFNDERRTWHDQLSHTVGCAHTQVSR